MKSAHAKHAYPLFLLFSLISIQDSALDLEWVKLNDPGENVNPHYKHTGPTITPQRSDSLGGRLRLAAVVLLLVTFPASARAQLANVQFTTTTSDGHITITGFSATGSGPLVIPGTINGLPVTMIGPNAFENSMTLTSAEVPDGVTSIGENAFENCILLNSVTIPDSVSSIGEEAFEYCTSLGSVTIPASVTTIEPGAFENCTSLKSAMLLTSVTNIEPGAFENCASLSSITIPTSVTSIGTEVFSGCSSLTSAIFQGSAPTMGPHVFYNVASGFTVYYYDPATGFKSPLWTDSSGDTYPAIDFPAIPQLGGGAFTGGESGTTGGAVSGQAVQPDAADATAYDKLGNACLLQGDYNQAVADYTKALQLEPNDKIASDNLSNALKKRQDEAMKFMVEGLGAWFKNDFDLALADLNQAIQLDPKFLAAYCNRSFLYESRGDFARAIADCNHAIELDPNFTAAYCNRGDSYRQKGEYDRAIADFSQAIQLEPDRANIYFDRGLAYFNKGENDKAIADFGQAIHPDPKIANASRGIDVNGQSRGDSDPVNHQYAWIDPNPENSNYYRGLAYFEKGDNDKAIADFTQAIQLDPKNADAYGRRGDAYSKQGDYDKAMADYQQAIRLNPKNVVAYHNLAWILATCPQAAFRDGKKAVENATKACELTEWKDSLYVDMLATANAEAGDFDNAVKWENQYLGTLNLRASDIADAKERLALYQAHQPHHADK